MSVFERMSLARSRAFKGATRVFNGITVCNNKYSFIDNSNGKLTN